MAELFPPIRTMAKPLPQFVRWSGLLNPEIGAELFLLDPSRPHPTHQNSLASGRPPIVYALEMDGGRHFSTILNSWPKGGIPHLRHGNEGLSYGDEQPTPMPP